MRRSVLNVVFFARLIVAAILGRLAMEVRLAWRRGRRTAPAPCRRIRRSTRLAQYLGQNWRDQ